MYESQSRYLVIRSSVRSKIQLRVISACAFILSLIKVANILNFVERLELVELCNFRMYLDYFQQRFSSSLCHSFFILRFFFYNLPELPLHLFSSLVKLSCHSVLSELLFFKFSIIFSLPLAVKVSCLFHRDHHLSPLYLLFLLFFLFNSSLKCCSHRLPFLLQLLICHLQLCSILPVVGSSVFFFVI